MNFTSFFKISFNVTNKKSKSTFVAPITFLLVSVASSWWPGAQMNLQYYRRRENGLRWQLAVYLTIVPSASHRSLVLAQYMLIQWIIELLCLDPRMYQSWVMGQIQQSDIVRLKFYLYNYGTGEKQLQQYIYKETQGPICVNYVMWAPQNLMQF